MLQGIAGCILSLWLPSGSYSPLLLLPTASSCALQHHNSRSGSLRHALLLQYKGTRARHWASKLFWL